MAEQTDNPPAISTAPTDQAVSGVAPSRPSVTAPLPHTARSRPPTHRDRLAAWLLLLLCLSLAAPAMVLNIQRPAVIDRNEAYTLLTSLHSIENARDSGGISSHSLDPWVPHLHGLPRYQAPPGITWIHLVLLDQLNTDYDSLRQFISRARLVSVLMGLITITSVFWAGQSVGGLRTAAVAGMVCATNPVLIYYSRLASPPIYFCAMTVLAIASALWALRPLRPTPSIPRQGIGWAVCGLIMGFAVLSLGPGALAAAALPILLITLLCPGRTNHVLGLLAALLIAALTALPWIMFVSWRDPSAWPMDWWKWVPINWLDYPRLLEVIAQRNALMILAFIPWTLWLIGAIVQPFSTSSTGVRTRLFLGWGWAIMTMFFLMAVPGPLRNGAMLAAIAAAAVLIGEVFNQYVDLAAHGRFARFWRLLRWPHTALLILVTLCIPLVLKHYIKLETLGIPPGQFEDPGWIYALVLTGSLLVIIAMGTRWLIKHWPAKTLTFWALWGAVFLGSLIVPFSRGAARNSPVREEARELHERLGSAPVYWWVPSTDAQDPVESSRAYASFILYAGRYLPSLTIDRVEKLRVAGESFYLLGPSKAPLTLNSVHIVQGYPTAGLLLYRVQAPSTRPYESESVTP